MYNTLNMIQQTLVIIKPDGVAGGFTDEVIKRYEAVGLKVIKRKDIMAPLNIVEKHYPMDPNYLKSIGEKTIADAILDRLIHQSHRLELHGESMRKKRGINKG